MPPARQSPANALRAAARSGALPASPDRQFGTAAGVDLYPAGHAPLAARRAGASSVSPLGGTITRMSDKQPPAEYRDHDHDIEALVDTAFEDPTQENRLAAAVAVAQL